MAVLMTSAPAGDHRDEFGVKVLRDLIWGVKEAFDREPNAPQSAENMLVRFAEALPPIATFLNRLPLLGPKYGNHFNELGSALKDWRGGRRHPLFDVRVARTAAPSIEVRGWADVVLAVEAVKRSRRSFRDAHRSIKKYDGENDGAIQEVVREFRKLEDLGGSDKIKTFRTEFSRGTSRGHYAEASELLDIGRQIMVRLGEDSVALHEFARQCVRRALFDFNYIKRHEG
jgi:hypothetical protein